MRRVKKNYDRSPRVAEVAGMRHAVVCFVRRMIDILKFLTHASHALTLAARHHSHRGKHGLVPPCIT